MALSDQEILEEKYKFKVERDKQNPDIEYIKFEDGREYKLQRPGFFDLHDSLSAYNMEGELIRLGLKNLFPMNKNSPPINEAWLEKNQTVGILLWSELLRGLLQHPRT